LRFDREGSDESFVYVQGWVHVKGERRSPVYIQVSDASPTRILADQQRSDVISVYPGVSLYCGFNAYMRVANRDQLEAPIRISAAGLPVQERVALAAHDWAHSQIPPGRLTNLRRQKLENLLLNETERLFHEQNLRSKPLYLQLDPSFICQLSCPSCHGDMAREGPFPRAFGPST
jgi:hypothetical protein